jgi:hypothetical protein
MGEMVRCYFVSSFFILIHFLLLFFYGLQLIDRDHIAAEKLLTESLTIFESQYGRLHHVISRLLHDLATVNDCYGRHEQAIQMHLEAIEIRRKTLGGMVFVEPSVFFFISLHFIQ